MNRWLLKMAITSLFHPESCAVFMVLRHDKWPWRGRRSSDRGWSCPSRPPMGTSPTRARSSHLQGLGLSRSSSRMATTYPTRRRAFRGSQSSGPVRLPAADRVVSSPRTSHCQRCCSSTRAGPSPPRWTTPRVPSLPGSSQRRSCPPCPS